MDFVQDAFTYLTQHPGEALYFFLLGLYLVLVLLRDDTQSATRTEDDYTSEFSNNRSTATQQLDHASGDFLRKVRDTTRRDQ